MGRLFPIEQETDLFLHIFTSLILSMQLCHMYLCHLALWNYFFCFIPYHSELEFENHNFFSSCASWLLLKTVVSFQIKADLECMYVEEECEKANSQTPLVFFLLMSFSYKIFSLLLNKWPHFCWMLACDVSTKWKDLFYNNCICMLCINYVPKTL